MDSVISRVAMRLLYLACGAAFMSVVFCVLRAILDPLRSIPGPLFARFSRWWYVKHIHRGHQDTDEIELHRKYGPIVRLTPNQYSFSDMSAVKIIYDHGSKFTKTDFYAPFGAPDIKRANLFQQKDIHTHADQRRKIAPLYSMTSILSYEPFVDNCMQLYLDQLDHFSDIAQPINVPIWMQYYAFDIIGAITTGNKYGFLENGSDFLGIIQELNVSQSFGVHLAAVNGAFHKHFVAFMRKLGKKPPFQVVQSHAVRSLAQKQHDIENGKSLQETTGKQDFAEKLLSLKAQGKIGDVGMMESIRSNIAAGSDTTAIALSAILYYLLCQPSTLAKLRQEIDDQKTTMEDSSDFITFTQAQNMPYLQAVIKEALRLHPSVGMQLPRTVPEGGATLAGHFFPGGTTVGTNPWVLHRQPELFGPDAHEFRPERWLENVEKAKQMDRYLFTFGGGARTCIGKNISMLEIQKLIPELLWRYDFEFADQRKEWQSFNRFFVYEKYFCVVKMRGEKVMR